jgi:histone-lysine N-methyltransferase SETMAR
MEWRHTSSPIKKKFKQTISTRKIVCTVFWDRKGVLLVEFLHQGSTINTGIYCNTLKKLRRAIQNKRCGMLSQGVVMLHDNVCPHNAAATQDLIATFGWVQVNHPPYRPDLASSDFHVFLQLKTFLGGWWFHNDEVKEAVNTWFTSPGGIILQCRDTNLYPTTISASTMVETMSKSSGTSIKWQYKWFGNKLLFSTARWNLLSE